jgi:hypothetical protein
MQGIYLTPHGYLKPFARIPSCQKGTRHFEEKKYLHNVRAVFIQRASSLDLNPFISVLYSVATPSDF